jgi:hypothetical protein
VESRRESTGQVAAMGFKGERPRGSSGADSNR